MKKVYCTKCKYIYRAPRQPIYYCRISGYVQDTFLKQEINFIPCRDKNYNNDCQDFNQKVCIFKRVFK